MPRTRGQLRAMAEAEDADHAEGEDTDGEDGLLYLDDSDYNLDIHDNESSVIASFLRNLMRRSISRIQNADNDPVDLDSDDSNYSEMITDHNSSRQNDNSSDGYEPVNGSDLDSSDDQMRHNPPYNICRSSKNSSAPAGSSKVSSGGQKRRRGESSHSLPSLISQRQMNGQKAQSSGAIACHLLPNHGETLHRYGTKGFCVKFDREASVLVHAAQDNMVRIYDCSRGHYDLSRTVTAQDVGWSIVAVDISHDGNVVAYSSWSDAIRTFTIPRDENGKMVGSKACSTCNNINHETLSLNPPEASLCLFSLCFSSDASEIIGGANDRHLYIYNRERNERTGRIEVSDEHVNAATFARAPNLIVTGGDDGIVKTWDRRVLNESSPHPCGVFTGHIAGITSIDTHDDERHLISNSKDQTIKLWDMRKFSPPDSIKEAKSRVESHNWDYRWMPTPRSILQNRTTSESDTSIRTYRGHVVRQTLIRCYFSPSFSTGQRYIYTGCSTGQVVVSILIIMSTDENFISKLIIASLRFFLPQIYDILTGNKVKYLKHKTRACIRDVTWHPYFPEIITTSWDTTVSRWYYSDGDDPIGSMRVSSRKQPVRRSARIAAAAAAAEARGHRLTTMSRVDSDTE